MRQHPTKHGRGNERGPRIIIVSLGPTQIEVPHDASTAEATAAVARALDDYFRRDEEGER